MNSDSAFRYLTKLNFGMTSSLDLDTWAFNMGNVASQNLGLSIHSLNINSNERTREDITVLHHYSIVSFWNDMKSSLFEIWKPTIWNLKIAVNRDSSSCLICFISNKVATQHIYGTSWESYKSSELLVESVWNRFQGKNTFSQNKTTRVNTENAIHVSGDIKFSQGFDACFRSILDILLSLFKLFW